MILRSFLILFCLIFFTLYANSQVTIGVKAGHTKSWRANVVFTDNDEYIHRNGFHVSLLSYIKLSKRLSIGLEPGFVQRVSASPFFFEQEQKLLINYLELPVMLSGRYPLWNEKLKINVKAGYGLSRCMSAVDDEPSIINNGSPEDFVSTFDHGLYGGLGIEYKIGHHRIFAGYDLYFGLMDATFTGRSKNRSIHLGLGFSTGF